MPTPITRREFLRDSAAAAASLTALSMLRTTAPARAAVSKQGPPALLVDALRSDDLVVAADAARLLGDLGMPEAVGPLGDYVTAWGHYAKTAGLDALGRIGSRDAIGPLRSVYADPRVDDDTNWWYGAASVRLAAALALLALGDDTAEAWLLDDDKSVTEVDRKEWALFSWFTPAVLRLPDGLAATRRLKRRITVEALTGDSREAHRFMVRTEALALIGTDEAVSALVGFTAHPSRYVRGRAAVCLLAASDYRNHVDRVVIMAQNDRTDFARIKACEALARHGRRFYAGRVADMASGAVDPFDRAAAIESLGRLGEEDHLPIVINAMKADDPYLRLCAVEAADRIGSPAAIDAAAAAGDDPNIRVRLHVAKCLAAHREGRVS